MTYDGPGHDPDDEEKRERLEWLLNKILEADDVDITQWEVNRDTSTSHSVHGGAMMEIGPTRIEAVGVADHEAFFHFNVELSDGKVAAVEDHSGTDDSPVTYADAANDWDETNPQCAECGQPFDSDEWEKTGGAGDPWGGVAIHDCPTDDCPGEVHVHY